MPKNPQKGEGYKARGVSDIAMLTRILQLIGLACRHGDYSWPQTRNGSTTVCCLDCGARAAYDLAHMRVYDPAATPISSRMELWHVEPPRAMVGQRRDVAELQRIWDAEPGRE